MTLSFLLIFVLLLPVYLVSAEWAKLDSRYPLAMAVLLLGAALVIASAGNLKVASALTPYVFYLLAGGAVAVGISQLRPSRFPS